MKVGRWNALRGMTVAILLAVLAFTVLVQYAPDSVALSPNNYGWNGLQEVASTYHVNFTLSLSSLPRFSVLAILQPSTAYSSDDAASVTRFLDGGGTLLVADKSGVANTLLRGIGSSITIENQSSISDRVFNWKTSSLPTALVLSGNEPYLNHVRGIAVNQPSPLVFAGPQANREAVTSRFSTTQGGAKGPFVVMASQRLGNGTVIVVGDSQFLLNSEWTVADNRVLVGNLFENRDVFIDTSHWAASPLTSSTAQTKAELNAVYGAISGIPTRYGFVLFFALVAYVLVPRSESKKSDSFGIRRKLAPVRRRFSPRNINGRTEGR